MAAMTENSKKVLNFLKENMGSSFTNAQVAEALGLSSATVVGSVSGLVKKGRATRTDSTAKGADGKEVTVKLITLTDEGYAFDPDAVESK